MDPPASGRQSPSTMPTHHEDGTLTAKHRSRHRLPRSPHRSPSPNKQQVTSPCTPSPARDSKTKSSPHSSDNCKDTRRQTSTPTKEQRDSPEVPSSVLSSSQLTRTDNNKKDTDDKETSGAPATPSQTPARQRTGTPSRHTEAEAASTPANAPSSTPNTNSLPPSFLSRKAHKISSMKKKKQATTAAAAANPSSPYYGSPGYIWNKLFCNSLEDRNDINTSDPLETTSEPGNSMSITTQNDSIPQDGCLSIAFTQAAEALQLNSEKTVRRNIQKSMSQAAAISSEIHLCEEIQLACTDIKTETQFTCHEKTSGICGPSAALLCGPATNESSLKTLVRIEQHREMDSLTNNLTMESQDEDDEAKTLHEAASPSNRSPDASVPSQPPPSQPSASSPSKAASPQKADISVQELQATTFIASLTLQNEHEEDHEGDSLTTNTAEARDDAGTESPAAEISSKSPPSPKPNTSATTPEHLGNKTSFDRVSYLRALNVSPTHPSSQDQSVTEIKDDKEDEKDLVSNESEGPVDDKEFDEEDFLPSEFKASGSNDVTKFVELFNTAVVAANQTSTSSPLKSKSPRPITSPSPEKETLVFTERSTASELQEQSERMQAARIEQSVSSQESAQLTFSVSMEQLKAEPKAEEDEISDEYHSKVQNLEDQLRSSEHLAGQREKEMISMEAKIKELQKSLEEMTAAQESASKDLALERKIIQELKAKGRQDLLALEKEKDKQVDELSREISVLEEINRINSAKYEEAQQKMQLEMDETIEIIKNDLQSAHHHLKDTQFSLDKCREELVDRDLEVAKLKEELSVTSIDLKACRRSLDDKKAQIELLTERVNDGNAFGLDRKSPQLEVDGLLELVNEKQAQIDILAQKLATKEDELGITKRSLTEKQGEIAELRKSRGNDAQETPMKTQQGLKALQLETSAMELKYSLSDESQMSSTLRTSGITPPRPSVLSSPMHPGNLTVKELLCQIKQLQQKVFELESELASNTHSQPIDSAGEAQDLFAQRKEMTIVLSEKEAEIIELRQRLESAQESLAQKEKELSAMIARAGVIKRSETSSHASSPSINARIHNSGTPHGVDESLQLHEKEKEALREQIVVLEDQIESLRKGHETTLFQLRQASEKDLSDLKLEMETRIERHLRTERELKDTLSTVNSADKEDLIEKIEQLESAKKAERTGGLREVQKKEELLQQICNLEKKQKELTSEHEFNLQKIREDSDLEIRRLREEIEKTRKESQEKELELQQAISSTASFEKEELLQQIDKLEAMLESERNCSVLVKMKVASLEKEVRRLVESHRDELLAQRNRYESELENLRRELLELNGVEDAMQVTTNDRDALEKELLQTKVAFQQCQIEIEQMKVSHEKSIEAIKSEMNEEIEKTENAAMDSIEELEEKIKELENRSMVAENEVKRMADETKTLTDEIADLKARATAKQKRTEELLAQLQAKDAEYKQTTDDLRSQISDKDAALLALGDQLADAKSRYKQLEESAAAMTSDLERSQDANSRATQELTTALDDLAKLKARHEKFVEEAEAATEAACDEARQETIQHAEIQFKQANQLYVKLKKQYDLGKRKIENLESRLQKAEASETSLKEELAVLKSAKVKVEADATKKSKEYRREMERLLTGAENFEAKLKEAEACNQRNLKKLAAAHAEKEKLQQEYMEIKNVCEELMAMVEAQQEG